MALHSEMKKSHPTHRSNAALLSCPCTASSPEAIQHLVIGPPLPEAALVHLRGIRIPSIAMLVHTGVVLVSEQESQQGTLTSRALERDWIAVFHV
jgi:hypothetical protein